MSLKVFLPSLLVLALSACAVGPDYQTPATERANITTATDGAAARASATFRFTVARASTSETST